MENIIIIRNVILSMREYQKENNVTKQCVTNAQYLYDIIKMNSTINVKTKAVLVFSKNNEENSFTIVSGHLILTLGDETVIEPSHEIFCYQNKSYFDNIKDLMSIFDDKVKLKSNIDIKKVISDHMHFMKISEQINNGEFIITDKDYYNQQADYIEKLYSNSII